MDFRAEEILPNGPMALKMGSIVIKGNGMYGHVPILWDLSWGSMGKLMGTSMCKWRFQSDFGKMNGES